MRKGIEIEVAADDRARLEAIVADRNRRQKHVERARIVLLSAAGVGTVAIMRRVGCAKATVWRWQERSRASTACCATGPARRARRRWPKRWSSAWLR